MRVLIVSPHYDDAPLSLGQSMVDGELAQHRVTVGVVCSKSNWTIWFHPTRRRWPLASAIRVTEELWNGLRFGYRVRLGGVEETPLRTGRLENETFLDPSFDASAPESAEALAPVEAVLRRWAGDHDLVIAPLSLGDHVDHQLCREAARRLMLDGVAVAFYEDRPYACIVDDDGLAAAAKKVDERLVRRPVSGPMGPAKHRRIFYPSQFDAYFLDAIAADEDGQRREHVWVLPESTWP